MPPLFLTGADRRRQRLQTGAERLDLLPQRLSILPQALHRLQQITQVVGMAGQLGFERCDLFRRRLLFHCGLQLLAQRIALRLQASSVAPIVKLSPGQRVGIVSQSLRFGALLRSFCDEYTQGLQIAGPALFDPPESLSAYLSGKDAVLVPEGYEKLCTQKALGLLTQFAAHARLISCSYHIDEGSAIYLTERLERLLANRSPK